MKKPYCYTQLLGNISFLLGIVFVICGLLNQVGLLPTTPTSKGDPAIVFPVVGFTLALVGALLCFVMSCKEKKLKRLLKDGIATQGSVTEIKQLSFTHWGSQSPYIVYFSYEYEGVACRGKSNLLWSTPNISNSDRITVYVNKKNKHQCVVNLYSQGL